VKCFYLGKPNSSVRIVRVSYPNKFKSCRGFSCLNAYLVRLSNLLQRINANGDHGRAYVDLVSIDEDAHVPRQLGVAQPTGGN
jgi:hypothetical protein